MGFDGFYGNQGVKDTIYQMLLHNRLPHAVIIEGAAGLGKGFFARSLAQAIMCSRDVLSCDECINCRKIQRGIHPDFSMIDQGKDKSISVDSIRGIQKNLRIYPNEAQYKVYLIAQAQNMTVQAQNALLKMLEEPPTFAIFLLTVDKKEKLLDTVISRCVCLKLEQVHDNAMFEFLNAQKGISQQNIQEIALSSQGNIGRANSILNKKSREQDEKQKLMCIELFNKLCFENEFVFLNYYQEIYKNKANIKDFLDMLICLCYDILCVSNNRKAEYYGQSLEALEQLKNQFNNKQVMKMLQLISAAQQELLQNVNFSACINALMIGIWEELYG